MSHDPRTDGELELRAADSPLVRNLYLPAQRFIRVEWIGGAVLLVASLVALIWANSPWASSYVELWHTPVGFTLGPLRVAFDLHHLVNDGLMAIFFFVVALEMKRELLRGALSSRRGAALPVIAAIGGMVLPAVLFVLVVGEGDDLRGWGVPMATDIAFALGVLGLLGTRVPSSMRIFLLALAVVDDLGAIVVIALYYTGSISWGALGAALLAGAVIYGMQRVGVQEVFAYVVVGFVLWLAVYESGVHATLAGVLLGFLTPARPVFEREEFTSRSSVLFDAFEDAMTRGDVNLAQASLGQIEVLAVGNEAPLERQLRHFHLWSSFAILPLFALANAGVALPFGAMGEALSHPVTVGILAGLVVGKIVGISVACWIAVRFGLADLPTGARWGHIIGVAALAGIGFTVSMFIAELAFVSPERVVAAKIGVLMASGLAAIVGAGILLSARPAPERA